MFSPRWTVLVLLAACLLGSTLPACGGGTPPPQSPPLYEENARRAYAAALAEIEDRDWESATSMLEQIRREYVYSRYARLAELRLADIAYSEEKYAEAVSAYRQYVKDHPNDPENVYARYRTCKGLFEQFGDSFMLPPQEERDLAAAVDAYAALGAFLRDYPDYRFAPELSYMALVTGGLLARHELYVARFYLRDQRFQAAEARCRYAIERYPGSGLEPEALVLLGETYLKLKRPKEARLALERVLSEHPDSAFYVPASRFLAEIPALSR